MYSVSTNQIADILHFNHKRNESVWNYGSIFDLDKSLYTYHLTEDYQKILCLHLPLKPC